MKKIAEKPAYARRHAILKALRPLGWIETQQNQTDAHLEAWMRPVKGQQIPVSIDKIHAALKQAGLPHFEKADENSPLVIGPSYAIHHEGGGNIFIQCTRRTVVGDEWRTGKLPQDLK